MREESTCGVSRVGRASTYHERERDERETRDVAPEPEHLAVRDEDDGHILEDGVHRDREELLRRVSEVRGREVLTSDLDPV